MKTAVADTSIERYKALVAEGVVTRCQAAILHKLEEGTEYTRAEISEMTKLPINSVCGRVHELIHEVKRLEEGSKRACKVTGNTAHTVRLVGAANT